MKNYQGGAITPIMRWLHSAITGWLHNPDHQVAP